ncbi:MAG: AIR synthase-related protein [Pirellulales bacterium]
MIRQAVYEPVPETPFTCDAPPADLNQALLDILASPNVASKEWVIRQYDHEVQGGSVIKPLVGVTNDGPSDAAVVRPRLSSRRGLVISNGMNPRYGDLDPYHMATSAIDEAIRNCVAVGADPARIAILDNFCWGNTDRPETLGSLVRARHLPATTSRSRLATPFISGKDSLNNEYHYDDNGTPRTISIPPSLLISALGQVDDVARCVTMDFKAAGNLIYQVGATFDELGGSHFGLVTGATGGVPRVDAEVARRTFAAVHRAIRGSLVRACHDLSEGGLAVAAAEMAFAGGLGAELRLADVPHRLTAEQTTAATLLFAESNTRFLCEVAPDAQAAFEAALADVPCALVGRVTGEPRLRISDIVTDGESTYVVDTAIDELKRAWQGTFDW